MFKRLLLIVSFCGCAQTSAMPLEQIEKFVSARLVLEMASSNMRVKVQTGSLDSRLKLRACADITPFIPTGTRLWGRAHVGLRCNEKPGWVVFVPIEVQIFARIAVAAKLLTAGENLDPQDIVMEEREITRLPGEPVMNWEQVSSRILTRGYVLGQPLVLSAFRSRPVVGGGDPVKIVIQGEGFSIITDGIALAQAEAGQTIRVRLENGRTLQGIAQADRRVAVKL